MELITNTTFKEMGTILEDAESILLFPHVNPDPDSMGAGMALCRALRAQGKRCWVLIDEALPAYLQFMMKRTAAQARADRDTAGDPDRDPAGITVTTDHGILGTPDICMLIDCSDEKRYAARKEIFEAGKKKLCLDHHRISESGCDYYYIDPDAAATAQLVYHLMKEMDWPLNQKIASELYTGINGDTGCFMHSNTTPEIHRIAAELMEYGVDINTVNVNLYQSKDPKAVMVHVKALQSMDFIAGGKGVMARITQEELDQLGATLEHADTVIDDLRAIEGVEIAAFLKEADDGIHVSMRSKTTGNVADIAKKFGGGGHFKAAGFTLDLPLDEVYEKLRDQLIAVLG